MSRITSIAMTLTVAGGLMGASLPALADGPTDFVYYDGQFHQSYAEPYNGGASGAPSGYFYYDGQFQPTFEPAADAQNRTASSVPTNHFFYDGQFHDTYS